MRRAYVHRLPASAPDDVSGLVSAIGAGDIHPGSIVAILGKTEGNGCVNDFTRGFAVASLKAAMAAYLPPFTVDHIAFVMSGGTEGGLSPHWLVFEVRESSEPPGEPALAIAAGQTRPLLPEEIGRRPQIEAVAETVSTLLREAGIAGPGDVHYVQVKCPLLTAARRGEAEARGATVATPDTLKSMGLSRGASALGVAMALGEVAGTDLADVAVGRQLDLWSGRASCSAGVELVTNEIVVMGNSAVWSGPLVIGHAVMRDAIDLPAIQGALASVGLDTAGQLDPASSARIEAVLLKAEASTTGTIRDRRHTMLDDSDIASTRHARAFVGGLVAGVIGHTELFVSGGAEHQGPDGGGPIAVIARRG